MEEFVRVAGVEEFSEGRGRTVTLDGESIAVFRRKGHYFAFTDRCPHMGASLAMGFLTTGHQLQCSWHGWKFDVRSGECRTRSWAKILIYEVKVQGGDVLIRRPPRPAGGPEGEQGEDEAWMRWNPDGPSGPGGSAGL